MNHLKNESPKQLNLGDILKMIHNSYEYVSERLNIKLGKFESGYKADFLRVKYSPFTIMTENNAFGHVFYGLYPNFKPSHVYIDGKEVVKDYKLTSRKLLDELSLAKDYSEKLWIKVTQK